MIRKSLSISIVMSFIINMVVAENCRINSLEKRIEYLENKVKELETKVSCNISNLLWEDLKEGISKTKIQSNFGNPDRKGKFSNGDEFWGFKNYTLKFDKNGRLKNWSKPFMN